MNAHPTIALAESITRSSGGHILRNDHPGGEPHASSVVADVLPSGQPRGEALCESAAGDTPALDHVASETQLPPVEGTISNQPPATHGSGPRDRTPDGWLELRIWAEMFHDAQQQRIASVNRAERGGVDPDLYSAYVESLEAAEKVCGTAMRKCYKRVVPAEILAWQQAQKGIGDHLFARLIGHLGHPRQATPHRWVGEGSDRILVADEPYERTVSQLWAYCGHGDPTRKKRKGMTAEEAFTLGNPHLKMLVHLNAEACVKAGVRKHEGAPTKFDPHSRYSITELGQVYLDARATYAKRDGWSDLHQQNAALRKVGKELLRGLWIIAGSQTNTEAHDPGASGDENEDGE